MADIRYDISLGVDNALRGFDQLTNKLKKVNDDFEEINSKIAGFGVALGATLTGLAANAAAFADEMGDIAAANETTIASVVGLGSALQGAGGNIDGVGRMFQTFSNNIESANGGNLKMIDTLGKMGISIKDLGTIGTEELRNKVLKSLAEIPNEAERNAKAVDLFGKSMMGVDIKAFVADLDAQQAKYRENEQALQTAGQAFDKMQSIMRDIKIAAAEAFEPLFKWITKLNIEIPTLTTAIKLMAATLALAVSASVLAGFGKLLILLKDIGTVVSKNKLITIIAAAISVGSAIGVWSGLTKDAADESENLNTKLDETSEKTKEVQRDQTGLLDAIQKQKDSLTQVTEGYAKQIENIKNKIDLESQALTLNEDQKKIAQERAAIEQGAQNALMALKNKYDSLDASSRAARLGDYEKERAAIQKNAELAKVDIENRIKGMQQYRDVLQNFLNLQNTYAEGENRMFQMRAKNALDNSSWDQRIILEEKLNQITKVRQALISETSKLSSQDQAGAAAVISEITDNVDLLKLGYSDINTQMANMIQNNVTLGNISQETADRLLTQTAGIRQGLTTTSEAVANQQLQITAQSRTFVSGWNKAFRDYAESATNAATQAQRIFQKVTTGMEDMIVNFAKTGKLEWKGFLNSIVEELLRSQIRQLMMQVLGGGYGSGGGAGSKGLLGLGGVFGFLASGGPASSNRAYIVGERGPELFVPDSNGTVVPNSSLGGTTVVNYNISAVDAQSFKQMVARDPQFLYAVAEQGRRSLPGGR